MSLDMDIKYKSTVIEKGKPEVYHDGGSRGGGVISFCCGTCGDKSTKETFYFWKENRESEQSIIDLLGDHLNLPDINSRRDTLVGLLDCSACDSTHALHINYGEVSNGHWQCSLHKVVLCNS